MLWIKMAVSRGEPRCIAIPHTSYFLVHGYGYVMNQDSNQPKSSLLLRGSGECLFGTEKKTRYMLTKLRR